jgi:hypothetical protein
MDVVIFTRTGSAIRYIWNVFVENYFPASGGLWFVLYGSIRGKERDEPEKYEYIYNI